MTGDLHPPIEGLGFAGGSSRRQAARLMSRASVAGEAGSFVLDLVDEAGVVMASAPSSEITLDPRLGGAPRRLTFPDGALFETHDHSAIESVFGQDHWTALHNWEAFRPRLLGVTLACLVGIFLIWRYGLDILVSGAIALTPPVVIDQIDRGSIRTIDATLAVESKLSDDQKASAQAVFDRMVATLPPEVAEEHDFNLIFRGLPGMGPNAAALPGGTVIVTDEFIKRFPKDDVLASVIGHEIGHVTEQHGLRQLYRSLGLFFLVTMLAGDTGPILEDVLLEGNALLSLSYSRDHERAADDFGLRLTHEAGYDPAAMKIFFVDIRKITGDQDSWLSSHPAHSERIENIEAFVDALD